MAPSALTYADSGVDIDAGNELVNRIKPLAKATHRLGVMGGIGGFGGLFDLKAAGFTDPVLVSATDGVGTKLKIAQTTGRHRKIGIDLVAMCVNDLIVQGAEPLFFLDYFATGNLAVDVAEAVVAGVAEGCSMAGCALLGGETAEMPGMYPDGEYDLAGFAVGAVERSQLLPHGDIAAGDVLLGLASSGVHSNGYSLVRKILEKDLLMYSDAAPFQPGATLGEVLLTPTRIYVKSCLAAVKTGKVKAMAHITGGGLSENIPRVLPKGLGVMLKRDSWPISPLFQWLRDSAALDDVEFFRTFNCGIGMVLLARAEHAAELSTLLQAEGETVYNLGEVVADEARSVRYV